MFDNLYALATSDGEKFPAIIKQAQPSIADSNGTVRLSFSLSVGNKGRCKFNPVFCMIVKSFYGIITNKQFVHFSF